MPSTARFPRKVLRGYFTHARKWAAKNHQLKLDFLLKGKRKTETGTCYLLNNSRVKGCFRIYRYLLPVSTTSVFEPSSPEHNGHVDEQRVIGRMLPNTGSLSKAVSAVSVVMRLHRSQNELAVLVQEPLRTEVRSIEAVGRRVTMALPEVHQAHGPLGYEHAFVPIVLRRGVWDAEWSWGAPAERLFN